METIVVGVEGSERSADALALARRLAHPADRLLLVCAYPGDPIYAGDGGPNYQGRCARTPRRRCVGCRARRERSRAPSPTVVRRGRCRPSRPRPAPRSSSWAPATPGPCGVSCREAPGSTCCTAHRAPWRSLRRGTASTRMPRSRWSRARTTGRSRRAARCGWPRTSPGSLARSCAWCACSTLRGRRTPPRASARRTTCGTSSMASIRRFAPRGRSSTATPPRSSFARRSVIRAAACATIVVPRMAQPSAERGHSGVPVSVGIPHPG
jgi:hypothetical protein